MRFLRKFMGDASGNVTIMSALALPCMIGFIALAAEFGQGLLIKMQDQRIADAAAYASAVAYLSTSSTSTMQSVGQNVATLNGLAPSAVSVNLVTSLPRVSADAAVQATVTTNETMLFATVLNYGSSTTISATAFAQMPPAVPVCILALDPSASGITFTGGTSINAPTCSVASNSTMTVPCGDGIAAEAVYYGTTAPSVGCTGSISAPINKATTPDPFASNPGVTTASARAMANASLVGPTLGTIPSGTDISFDWTSSAVAAAASAGCAASFSSATWTMTCPAGGTYNFGSITLGGGITVNFNAGGSNTTVYNFSGSITDSGSALTFGPGKYTVAKGVSTGGGSTTSFGAGVFNIGRSSTLCNGAGYYSICNNGLSLTFGGPSTFSLTSGIYNNGGSKLALGSGTSNSYNIGAASDGNALNFGGGSATSFADAQGSNSIFQLAGNFTEGGGACTIIPAAVTHDINGNLNVAGGLSLGSGLYAINGYFGAGVVGGGDVWCAGSNVGISGMNVTIAVSGTSTITTSGQCNGSAFCIGSGFSDVALVAPSSGTYRQIAVVGPTSPSNSAAVSVGEGASSTDFGGALYFPYGPLTLSGGARVGNVPGQCFELVASSIALTGGTSATASPCVTTAAAVSSPVLVQ